MFVGIQGSIDSYDSSTIGRIDFSFVILQAPAWLEGNPADAAGC